MTRPYTGPVHDCPACKIEGSDGPSHRLPKDKLLCADHWRRTPKALRDNVSVTWKARKAKKPTAARLHRIWVVAVLRYWRRIEDAACGLIAGTLTPDDAISLVGDASRAGGVA